MQRAIPATLMRGGSSKGLYFLARELERRTGGETDLRDRVLLAAMGSPDSRQIDGLGGAHPLTSKVAIVGPSADPAADVDYLFLQVFVDEARVSDAQTCGNIMAGVGPFAIENGIVDATADETAVRIRVVNTGGLATAHVRTPAGQVRYSGETRIDGVPGTAAPVVLDFEDIAGASCGALLPTGNARDEIDGIPVTLIDNGMPVVVVAATALGKHGTEDPGELEADAALRERVEALRLAAGPLMNLGDVSDKSVPKVSLVAPGARGVVATRTFIPRRVHEAIGVLGAISVATACVIPDSIAHETAGRALSEASPLRMDIEHPTGAITVELAVNHTSRPPKIDRAAIVRTARKLFAGEIYIPEHVFASSGP